MELGLLAVIAAVIGGGVAGGLCTTWSLARRTLTLEDRLNTVQEIITKRDKRAAAEVRWTKADQRADELAKSLKRMPEEQQPMNPWAFPG